MQTFLINNFLNFLDEKIVVQKDFAYLYLNKEFYKEEIIKQALLTYQDFFKQELKTLGNYHILKIQTKEQEYSNELLANEFANYLIGEMK